MTPLIQSEVFREAGLEYHEVSVLKSELVSFRLHFTLGLPCTHTVSTGLAADTR